MTDTRKHLLPVLIAATSGFAATSLQALELGTVDVHSSLGQPLRASIAYALAPQEQLAGYCVSVRSAASANDGAAIGVSIGQGTITLTGNAAVREPLLSLQVAADCPDAARLVREYTLFIDPASYSRPAVATPSPVAAVISDAPTVARSNSQARVTSAAPIENASRYRVQPGDTLTSIARRIEHRPAGLWSSVQALHAANPEAFIDNDPNRLLAGAWLSIPEQFGVVADRDDSKLQSAATTPAAQAQVTSRHVAQASVEQAPVAQAADSDTEAALSEASLYAESIQELASRAQVRATSANVPVASPVLSDARRTTDQQVEATESSMLDNPDRASLWWLIGGGILLLGSLLFFGLRRRDDQDPAPAFAEEKAHPLRRRSDSQTVTAPVDEDYELDDDSPTAENLLLDADLVVGSGFDTNTEMHVVEDVGPAANTRLDLELPDDSGLKSELPETDIIAPPSIETESILESEILPDDDDYDMSVLMDVTKAADIDDITERDLKAVRVANVDDTLLDEHYTVSQDVDFEVLEQDYEDELTATQALNLEIERATAELVASIDPNDVAGVDDDTDIGRTAELDARPKASVTELTTGKRLKTG